MKKLIIKIRNKINKFMAPIFFYLFRIFPIKWNKIVILSYDGKGYGDNAKYIVEELLKQNVNCDIVWATKDVKSLPDSIRSVKPYSLNWIFELCTARIWLNNARFRPYIRKRKKQCYIQLWHGWIMLKKIEYDVFDKFGYYQKCIINDNKLIDIIISNGKSTTSLIKNTLKFTGRILEYGTPRNDILVKPKNQNIENVYKKLKIDNGCKIMLYAPTFRANDNYQPYDIDLKMLKSLLMQKTKSKWEILVRLHPSISANRRCFDFNESVIDVTRYPDIQELLCASSLVITDYSSIMFDCIFANKPVILYANDIEDYMNDRGFYYSFDELPFPLAKNNSELFNLIKENNKDQIVNKYKNFKENYIEDGMASIRVANLIKDILENHEYE